MIKAFLSTSAINLIVVICMFLQGIYIANQFGVSGKGLSTLYINCFSIALLIGTGGIRQASSFLLKEGRFSKSQIVSAQNAFILIFSVFIMLLVACYFYFFLEPNNLIQISIILIFPFALYINYRSYYFLVTQNFVYINIIRTLQTVVPFVLFVLLDFISVIRIENQFITLFFSYIILYCIVSFKFNHFNHGITTHVSISNLWDILKLSCKYSFPLILLGLNFKVDSFILASYDIDMLGVYSVGVNFAELVWQLPMVISLVFFSYGLKQKGSTVAYSEFVVKKTILIMLLLIPTLLVYGLCVYFALPFIYGVDFSKASNVVLLMLPGVYFVTGFNLLNAEASSRGLPHLTLIPLVFGLIINVVLNLYLVPILGLYGAALSSSISYSCIFFIYVYIYFKYTALNTANFLIQDIFGSSLYKK